MSTQLGQLIPGGLPTSCYPKDPQAFYNLMFQLGSVQFPGLTGVVKSDTAPAINDQDKAWIKTQGGSPLGLIYIFFNGQWVARHLIPPLGTVRWLWVGLEADLVTFDGGDIQPAGIASGAMWQADHAFDGQVPIGPGLIPGDPQTRTVVVAKSLGEACHVLGMTEMPNHFHLVIKNAPAGATPLTSSNSLAGSRSDGNYSLAGITGPPDVGQSSATGGDPNAANTTVAHNIIQPSYGAFAIGRTQRVYYRGA